MTITIPENPDQLVEVLNDAKKVGDLLKNGQFGDVIKAYSDAFAKRDKGQVDQQLLDQIGSQLDERVQLKMAEYMKDHPVDQAGSLPEVARMAAAAAAAPQTSAGRALWSRQALGAKLNGIFDTSGELFQAFYGAGRSRERHAAKAAKYTEIMNSFGSEVPADGGFLIPEVLRSNLLQLSLETSVVRPRATVIPMDSLRVPIPIVDDTSHVSSVFGGVTAYWTEEAAALTESQASFGRVVLDAKKLTAYAEVPNELLADALAFSGFFDSKFPQALAYFEDIGFMTGTGAGEPLGFVSCPASVQVSAESGQPTQTIVWENITKMYARMLPQALRTAVWVASIDTFPQLATMALSVGTGGSAVWIGNTAGNSGADTPPVSILGRPVLFTEKTPALGTTGDISFVDFSYYLIGDRQQMQAMSSEHYKFANDKTAFRIIQRLDGRPWLQSALTPHNNSSNTLTAFVQLASR